MKYIAAVAAAFVAMTSALPAPAPAALPDGFQPISREEIMKRLESSPANPLEKRTPGGIYFCTGENYTGECAYAVEPLNTCITLSAPFYHNIGSFGPDAGALCRLTTSAETCTVHGDAFIEYPGTPNLRNYNGAFEGQNVGDFITSFFCQPCSACQ